MIELHHVSQGVTKGSSKMVKLVYQLYYVNLEGNQRKFQSIRICT